MTLTGSGTVSRIGTQAAVGRLPIKWGRQLQSFRYLQLTVSDVLVTVTFIIAVSHHGKHFFGPSQLSIEPKESLSSSRFGCLNSRQLSR